ncbi:MAG: ORF6N domain-containing protein, partial [Betaproteobacteria bacterium]|nr:ORF6N domain-containing protein [Betaproteobacteria bacterium]
LVARIRTIRGIKVLLDADLAELYGVSTKALVQAVKRNPARFPLDFMFLMTKQEVANLRSQIVTSSSPKRLDDLESRYDRQFKVVFDAIRALMAPPAPAPKRRIGFVAGD